MLQPFAEITQIHFSPHQSTLKTPWWQTEIWNITLTEVFRHFAQCLAEEPPAAIRALSLLGSEATRFALGISCRSSLQILSRSVRLDGDQVDRRFLASLVFIDYISVLCSLSFPSTLTSLPFTAIEKKPHIMMLPPPGFIVGLATGQVMSSAWFPPEMRVGTEAKHLVSHSLRVLWVFFCNDSSSFYLSFKRRSYIWPLCHKIQTSGVLPWWFVQSPPRISGSQLAGPSGSRSPLLPRLFADCSV